MQVCPIGNVVSWSSNDPFVGYKKLFFHRCLRAEHAVPCNLLYSADFDVSPVVTQVKSFQRTAHTDS